MIVIPQLFQCSHHFNFFVLWIVKVEVCICWKKECDGEHIKTRLFNSITDCLIFSSWNILWHVLICHSQCLGVGVQCGWISDSLKLVCGVDEYQTRWSWKEEWMNIELVEVGIWCEWISDLLKLIWGVDEYQTRWSWYVESGWISDSLKLIHGVDVRISNSLKLLRGVDEYQTCLSSCSKIIGWFHYMNKYPRRCCYPARKFVRTWISYFLEYDDKLILWLVLWIARFPLFILGLVVLQPCRASWVRWST